MTMEEIDWNVTNEGHLLDAMTGHKPVGISKNFQMFIICEKLSEFFNKDIKPMAIWKHLESMYNLEALDEIESLPFPNDETDFTLPEVEFGDLISRKEDKTDDKKATPKVKEVVKIIKEVKKEEKSPTRIVKEIQQRRDSKDGKNLVTVKKEIKKEPEKPKPVKGRSSLNISKEENKPARNVKSDDTSRPIKRPTRGSLKPDDVNTSGKASPVSLTPGGSKRRRINSDVSSQNL